MGGKIEEILTIIWEEGKKGAKGEEGGEKCGWPISQRFHNYNKVLLKSISCNYLQN